MANTVDFKHFVGSSNKWDQKINSGAWDNAMVFGKIWNGANWDYKIYAGSVKDGSSNITFLYDIPTGQELKEIENLIHINTDTSTFDNQTFIEAIQHVIGNYINLDEISNHIDQLEYMLYQKYLLFQLTRFHHYSLPFY